MLTTQNIFTDFVKVSNAEHFLTLFESSGVKIERIVSHSHASPKDFWYDQNYDEWVLVLKGEAALAFESGEMIEMKTGDYLLIPKNVKHRVEQTSEETVWLAVHVS